MDDSLCIAEIPYESGSLRFRYSRYLADDGTRWVRHGLLVEYNESGGVLAEGSYLHGREHGDWQEYHPNGQLAARGRYENGVEVGAWQFWDENGNVEA